MQENVVIETDVLVGYFLKLLQRDGAISNNTYLAASRLLKEGEKDNDNE